MSSSFLMVFLHASSRCFAPGTSLGFLWMAEMSLRESVCNTLYCAPVIFTFFIVPPFSVGCSPISGHRSGNSDWPCASNRVKSAQRPQSAARRADRRACEITHKICGYRCAHLRRRHASRRCASVFPIRPNNSLARTVLQEDDSAWRRQRLASDSELPEGAAPGPRAHPPRTQGAAALRIQDESEQCVRESGAESVGVSARSGFSFPR